MAIKTTYVKINEKFKYKIFSFKNIMNVWDVMTKRRIETMKVLYELNSADLKTLAARLKVSEPVAVKYLKPLLNANFVKKEDKVYTLTPLGRVAARQIKKYADFLKFIDRDAKYWTKRDLTYLPDHLLLEMPKIGNYRIISGGTSGIMQHYVEFSKHYTKSRFVRAISPIILPEHPSIFLSNVLSGGSVEAILTSGVIDVLRRNVPNEDLVKFYEHGGRILINDDVRGTVIVTDDALCLGFFLDIGVYDTTSGVISTEKSALEWCMDVYRYFRERSKLFIPEGLKVEEVARVKRK